jgi:hypothetical protein
VEEGKDEDKDKARGRDGGERWWKAEVEERERG